MPQTVAASLFLKRSEIAYGDVPGYTFAAGSVCPQDINQYAELKCTCVQNEWRSKLLMQRYMAMHSNQMSIAHNMRHCSPTFMKAIDGTL